MKYLLDTCAIAHNLTIITRDAEDMAETGARLLNPWDL
jgi:hypothetical protein